MGPEEPRSTVLSLEDEAIAVPFSKHTPLPLDDCRKLHLFVAIDRTSKFAFAELHEKRRGAMIKIKSQKLLDLVW